MSDIEFCTCGPQQEVPVIDVPDGWDPYCPGHGEPDEKYDPGDDL